jgi:hypothetical protein
LVGALLLAIAPLWAQTGSARIRVADARGTAIPQATVSLISRWDGSVRTLSTNDTGEVVWADLPLGDARFLVWAPGFRLRRMTVTVRNGEDQTVAAFLEVAPLEDVPDVETFQVPNSDKLDLIPELSPSQPQPKPSKRKWWQIFR